MTAPPLLIDSFAGGGGASLGIEMALGRSPDIAINHDPEALAMHVANHPSSRHYQTSVWDVDPIEACAGRPVDLMWLSPDCTFHSKARGAKPFRERDPARRRRGLAWVAVRWAKTVRPRVIALENVEEFADWGPLLDDGRPCPQRRGLTFRRFVKQLQNLGYAVDWQELRAADYGTPTTRKRLFLIARCDGGEIVWPEPTHDQYGRGGLAKWRAAAECIDWSLPCPSIFDRDRPLAENTLRRIARGIQRFVIDAAEPFIIPVTHHGDTRGQSTREPLRTVTAAQRGEHALVTPFVASLAHGDHARSPGIRCTGIDDPLRTIHAGGGNHALIAPFLVPRYGERPAQTPRTHDMVAPMPTIVPDSNQGALVAAFLAKHNGGHEATGTPLNRPTDTITARDHHSLVASHLIKLKGTARDGQPVDTPLHTVQAGGNHYAEVRAFLIKFYSEGGQWQDLREPMHTIPTKDRLGLVTIHGEPYAIVDIGMRMLQPRELFRAQGFPDSYVIDPMFNGRTLTKTAQVRMCGNSVCPPVAAAIVRANVAVIEREAAA